MAAATAACNVGGYPGLGHFHGRKCWQFTNRDAFKTFGCADCSGLEQTCLWSWGDTDVAQRAQQVPLACGAVTSQLTGNPCRGLFHLPDVPEQLIGKVMISTPPETPVTLALAATYLVP